MCVLNLNVRAITGAHPAASAYFGQHHLETLDSTLSPVAFLARRFPGKSEQEYRQHLGAFGISGLTGWGAGAPDTPS